MDKFELQKLRDLPIEEVAERLGMRVVRHKCLCPFHDDHHASMSFKKNKWKCWSCGESGDTIGLVEKVLRKDFLDACRWLADEHNVILSDKNYTAEPTPMCNFEASRYERFFERPWLSDEARRFLFDERRLDPRVVRWCRLTSWKDRQGTPWLQTPYYDREGRLVGVQNRNLSLPQLGEVGGGSPRFRFPQGSQCGIYNLPVLNLLKPGDELYITEGCSDCWAMLSAGHKAIAIPSATLLSQKDKELLQTLDSSPNGGRPGGGFTFHMYPDRDAPGERLFLQLKEVLPNLEHHQLPPGCKDFSEYYLSEGK
jgi:hypothetical protein